MVKIRELCPNCKGKGVYRKEWNDVRWWGYDLANAATVNRYKDEICPRCEGKGIVYTLECLNG